MLSRFFLVLGLVIGLSSQLLGQYKNSRSSNPARQFSSGQPLELQGVIEGAMRGGIVVTDANKQTYRISIGPGAKVHVTGKATPECLQTGQFVEFQGEINAQGAVQEKIKELTIVSLSPEKQMGLFPVEAAAAKGNAQAEAKTDGDDNKKVKSKRAAKGTIPAGKYRTVGRLMVGRDGKLHVHTGRAVLALELADQPAIALDFNNYMVASKGNKVSVKGVKMSTRSGLALVATEVSIELGDPLSSMKKTGAPAKLDAASTSNAAKE